MERDFEIGSRKFKLNKMDVFKQFHIARKVMPMISDIASGMKSFTKVKEFDTMEEDQKFEMISRFASPIFNGLSKLNDEDANKLLLGLLSCVEMQQATGNWSKVATDSMIMMQDIEFPHLIQIAGRSFMFNMSGFFGVLPRS